MGGLLRGAAGVFNEPLSDLMKVLASLVDSHNRILVPGFHDKVRALGCCPNTRLVLPGGFSTKVKFRQ